MKSMKKIVYVILAGTLLGLVGCQNEADAPAANGDTTGPYINLQQYEFTTEVGTPLDFSNITGYDDYDGLLTTTVSGTINYDVAGDYYPVISCTDYSGNTTEVGITVHVVEKTSTAVPEASASATAESTTCELAGAADPSQPCSRVLEETTAQYTKLYAGEEGAQACQVDAGDDGQWVCEIITDNSGSFWGYGLKQAENQETAEE